MSEPQTAVFNASSIDPEKDFQCFGTIEPTHQECIDCQFKGKCAEKAGVK